jgi:UDP-N-acetylmuramate--alanine ligase
LLAVALQGSGLDPSFAVGGELARHGTNAHQGTDDVFVVEADESDGSFLVYRPDVAIVTNVQPDHLDFYGSFAVVQAAYDAFARTVRPGGLIVTCADDAGAVALAARARSGDVRVLTYGFDPDADVVLRDHQQDGLTSAATLVDGGVEHRLSLGIPGRHNALNAVAAYAAAVHGLGQDPAGVLAGLASFTGTRRRFEPKGEAGDVVVIDDYAHNAGKVAAVVETAVRLVEPPGRLIVVFQPHLYSRTLDFATELGHGLAPADIIVVMDVYAAREDPVPGVSGQLVADAVSDARADAEVHYVPSWSEVPGAVVGLARPGDLVLTVGAGDVTMIGPEVLRLLGGGPP